MILPKRVVCALLTALVTATLLFRYPTETSHELGADTTFIHTLTSAIVQNGFAPWILHPTSYFGLYALSYPSAIPFSLAAGNLVTGLPIEGVMLVFGWVVSVGGILAAFFAARKIRRDDIFALLVATLFSVAPFFVKDTFWVGSSRGFVVALLPVFLLLLIKSLKESAVRHIVFVFILFIVLAAIHRMGFLTLFLLIAFVFAIPFHKVTQKLRFKLFRYERPARYAVVATALVGFVGTFYIQVLFPGIAGANVTEQYGAGAFFRGTSFPVLLANMGVSISGKVGPLFPLAIAGLIAYTWNRPKEATDKFLLTSAFLFLPLLSLRDYMVEFMIPIFVLFLVLGLMWIRRALPRRRRLVAVILIILLVGSIATSWQLKDYWREKYVTDAAITDTTYATGLYIMYGTDGTVVSNDGLIGGQLAAVSGRPVMPLGGASLHWTGPQLLTWGFVSRDGVNVRLIQLTSITFNTDEIYVPVGMRNVETDWETILFYREPAAAEQQLRRYDVHYVVVNMIRPSTFISYGQDRPSIYLTSILPDSSYIVYEDGAHSMWYRG